MEFSSGVVTEFWATFDGVSVLRISGLLFRQSRAFLEIFTWLDNCRGFPRNPGIILWNPITRSMVFGLGFGGLGDLGSGVAGSWAYGATVPHTGQVPAPLKSVSPTLRSSKAACIHPKIFESRDSCEH